MKNVKAIADEYRVCLTDHTFLRSFSVGFLYLLGSLIINYLAGTYASLHAGKPVRDLILDHVPTFQVDDLFVYGAFLMWLFVLLVLLYAPRTFPFVFKALALFIVIRSFFIILTHIGGPAHEALLDPNRVFDKLTFSGDLFFSGHTGFPFLLALIFWESKMLRGIFLVSSVVFALAVLMGHLHYSIDVFGAFFITDSIFRIAQRFFAQDYERLAAQVRS